MTDTVIQYLLTSSMVLGTGSWLAANLAMAWYAYSLGKKNRHPMAKLFLWSSLVACLMSLLNVTIEVILIATGYSEDIYHMIEDYYKQMINASYWLYGASFMAWLAASIGFVYCIMHTQGATQAPSPSGGTSGAPT